MRKIVASLGGVIAVVALLLVGAIATGSYHQASAQAASLQGVWRGSGRVKFSSGNTERARCRVSFSRVSGRTYRMNAVCATPSARVSQTANLRRVGSGRYSGRFYNSEYNFSGSISVRQRGRRLTASLRGDGGSAQIYLRR